MGMAVISALNKPAPCTMLVRHIYIYPGMAYRPISGLHLRGCTSPARVEIGIGNTCKYFA